VATVAGAVAPARTGEEGLNVADWQKEIGAMTLFVPDLDRCKAFYQDVFGLQARCPDQDTAMFRFTNLFVFLHKAAEVPQPAAEIGQEAAKGAGQFAIIVDDVDAVCAELGQHGVELISGPADRPWGMRTATFADPAGQIWEIAQETPGDPAP
jgi:catechol 2,3-dioxygenase-like lactoylglutathione lyase family enzyme